MIRNRRALDMRKQLVLPGVSSSACGLANRSRGFAKPQASRHGYRPNTYPITSVISWCVIFFSSPSGISDRPLLVISSMLCRRIVSCTLPGRSNVMLVAVSALMRPVAILPSVVATRNST